MVASPEAAIPSLDDFPAGTSSEQVQRFRQLVRAAIEEGEAPDTVVVSWEVTRDEWGLALTITRDYSKR
jgi:hypothetical protein